METLASNDQDYALWLLLLKVRRCISKTREKELSAYDVTPEQAGVLFIVQALNSRTTPAEISRLTFREPHTVSVLISRMEKKGLVKKVKDMDKKNMIRIVITEKGQEAYNQSSQRTTIHNTMSALSEAERRQLTSLLRRLSDRALKELGEYYKPPFASSQESEQLSSALY